jgi:ribosomal protein S18 acetylase RimI-like enzyme
MTSHARGAEGFVEARPTLREEAQTLQAALHQSISTSQDAFLKTEDDVDARPIDYWEKDIADATWAIIRRGEETVGIAVARVPHRESDTDISPATARFIESVWIAPELRGRRMGERLVRFLFEVECQENPDISEFLLWVFAGNSPAIRLYDRMGFEDTGISQSENRLRKKELKFRYRLTFDTVAVKAAAMVVNEAARRNDLREFGVTYRILGGNTE